MSRTRNLKPGFFKNEVLAECPPLGRILFAGLWTIADREGRLEDRPRRIKAELLPYDDCDVDVLLEGLAARGFILRYEASGDRFIQVAAWGKHQQPHIKETASILPAPCLTGASTVLEEDEHGSSTEVAALDTSSLNLDTLTSNLDPPVSPRGGQAEPKPKKPRATQLAPDWKPSGECIQWAISKRFDLWVNLTEATAEFVEYWTEGEGAGQARINWELTWKNRIKDLAERAEARGVKSKGANGAGVSDETYSFDVDEQTGKRIPLAGHWATGQLPYGARSPAEVMQIHKGKLRERRNGGTAH